MKLFTEQLELRGIKNESSKKGNVYYVVNCENLQTGEPFQFYCPDANAFPDSLKKGDKVTFELSYNRYKNLVVSKVNKVG